MMTFEKVLDVFQAYLMEDRAREVIRASRGYLVVDWESENDDRPLNQLCRTPEHLRDVLRAHYEEYQGSLVTGGYRRETTAAEGDAIRRMGAAIADVCGRS